MNEVEHLTARRSRVVLSGTMLLVATVLLVGLLLGTRAPTASTYTVTFPQGSTLRMDPAVFDTIPLRQVDQTVWLEFEVGDTLAVTNDDLFTHVLWAIRVRPGETVEYTFTQTGTFTGK